MYMSAKAILDSDLRLTDGKKAIRDLLIDGNSWEVQHLVADTGDWLPGREVLVPPELLQQPMRKESCVPVQLGKADVECCDDITADEPVSRQKAYYMACSEGPPAWACHWNPKLRSLKELLTYSIEGHGSVAGVITDVIIWCDEIWHARYLVCDMGSLFAARLLVIPTKIVKNILWNYRTVEVLCNAQTFSVIPEFEGVDDLTDDYERELYRLYHGRVGSWW